MKQIIQSFKTGETILEDVPAPIISKGQVLIRTTYSLVSLGTERMLVEFGKANFIQKARQQPDKVKEVLNKIKTDGLQPTINAVFNKLGQPLQLGYCNVGKVVAIGKGVENFSIGDRVASNGPHAEYVDVPQNLVVKIPDAYEDVVIYDAKGKVRSLVERIDINGSTLYFMTVFGDIKESLNVYLINSFKEKSIVTNLDFIPESIVGTIKNPLLFEVIDESIVMYPNPFESKFELSIDSESASSVKVELCNIVGQTLYSKIYNVVVGKNIIEVTPDNNNYLLKGIYIIKISKEDNVYIKKIIKN